MVDLRTYICNMCLFVISLEIQNSKNDTLKKKDLLIKIKMPKEYQES